MDPDEYLSYQAYKFHKAAAILTSPHPIRENLKNAYINQLMLIEHDGVPDIIKEDFHQLKILMSNIPVIDMVLSVNVTVERMNDFEINRAIFLINKIHELLTKQGYLRLPTG